MAELVDALDLGSNGSSVGVRVPLPAPQVINEHLICSFLYCVIILIGDKNVLWETCQR